MANCVDGIYKGQKCNDDRYGLMYWNAEERMYEKRSGYTNADGKISYNLYGDPTGSKGTFDLPKEWFNDAYNAVTGDYNFMRSTKERLAIVFAIIAGLVMLLFTYKRFAR